MANHDEGRRSRRDFFRTAGGALLASPLLARPALAQVPELELPEPPGRNLGWAVVGLGRLAINQILPAMAGCRRSAVPRW